MANPSGWPAEANIIGEIEREYEVIDGVYTKHGYWVPNKKEVVYKDVYDKDWNKIRNHIDYYYVLEWNPLPNDPLRQEDKEIYKYTVYTE